MNNKKENLIISILEKDLKHIKKCLKDQDKQIESIRKNGFDKEIHHGNQDSIWTGLHYTQGYCNGHIQLTESIFHLLKQKDYKAIEKIIENNNKIDIENKKYLKKIFDDIKIKIKK